jgi:AcrR family transcriptional regulator
MVSDALVRDTIREYIYYCSMITDIPSTILDAAVQAARESGRDVADVPLQAIARRAGISRVTLYRRIGSRQALDEAVRAAGIDPGGRPEVRERAVTAAAAIIRERGFGAFTLEAVAVAAQCSVPALHTQLGGREGLLTALFERYTPLPRIEEELETSPDFASGVRAIYAALLDAFAAEPELLRAFLADALVRPEGPAAQHVRTHYVPRIFGSMGRWLMAQIGAGRCRSLPLFVLMQLLAGPAFVYLISQIVLPPGSPLAPPSREEIVEQLSDSFVRAVALPDPALDATARNTP